MGFDVYGKHPHAKRGEYFRNNVWWWRPLADFVINACRVDPNGWYENGGHEIDEETAVRIADTLDRLLMGKAVQKYARMYARQLKKLPLQMCVICHGTGKRNDKIVKGTCNACDGTGAEKAWATNYPFSTENVREFSRFCRASGGFTIW